MIFTYLQIQTRRLLSNWICGVGFSVNTTKHYKILLMRTSEKTHRSLSYIVSYIEILMERVARKSKIVLLCILHLGYILH